MASDMKKTPTHLPPSVFRLPKKLNCHYASHVDGYKSNHLDGYKSNHLDRQNRTLQMQPLKRLQIKSPSTVTNQINSIDGYKSNQLDRRLQIKSPRGLGPLGPGTLDSEHHRVRDDDLVEIVVGRKLKLPQHRLTPIANELWAHQPVENEELAISVHIPVQAHKTNGGNLRETTTRRGRRGRRGVGEVGVCAKRIYIYTSYIYMYPE